MTHQPGTVSTRARATGAQANRRRFHGTASVAFVAVIAAAAGAVAMGASRSVPWRSGGWGSAMRPYAGCASLNWRSISCECAGCRYSSGTTGAERCLTLADLGGRAAHRGADG